MRQEAANALMYALWTGTLAGEIQAPSGKSLPLVDGELLRPGPFGLQRIGQTPPPRLTHEQKLSSVALQKPQRPVAQYPTGVEQFSDLGPRLAAQHDSERVATAEDKFLAEIEPGPDPDTLEPDQPRSDDRAVWGASEGGDARALILDARQAVLKESRQEREGSIRRGTARELRFKDGTTKTVPIARAASGVRKIAVTPELERRALAALAREEARPPVPPPLLFGKSSPLTNEWVAADKPGPMTNAGWGDAPSNTDPVWKCPIPGSVARADWHKFDPRGCLLPSTTMRRERVFDLALVEQYTREAVKEQTEYSPELKALVRQINKGAACPEDEWAETEARAQARESAAMAGHGAHESDEAGAAAADARANEGFVEGEPPPQVDEVFEPREIETARILKQRLIKALYEELGLVAMARGKRVMSKQDAARFIEAMLDLKLEDTVAFARTFLDTLLARNKPKKDVAPQLPDHSGTEMEIIETSNKNYEYAQRKSDTEE
jgi:hypothetical protein